MECWKMLQSVHVTVSRKFVMLAGAATRRKRRKRRRNWNTGRINSEEQGSCVENIATNEFIKYERKQMKHENSYIQREREGVEPQLFANVLHPLRHESLMELNCWPRNTSVLLSGEDMFSGLRHSIIGCHKLTFQELSVRLGAYGCFARNSCWIGVGERNLHSCHLHLD